MSLTPQQLQAIRAVGDAIVEAVKAGGTTGAPAGVMYAALMQYGCTLDQFNQFTGALVRAGKIRRQGNLFFLADGAAK